MALRACELGKIVCAGGDMRIDWRRRDRRCPGSSDGDSAGVASRVPDRPTGEAGDEREEKRDQNDRGLSCSRRDVTLASQLRSNRDRGGWHHHDYSTAQPGVFRTNYRACTQLSTEADRGTPMSRRPQPSECENRPCAPPNSSPPANAKSSSCSPADTQTGKSRAGCTSPCVQPSGTAPASGASSILLPARLSSSSHSPTTSRNQVRRSADGLDADSTFQPTPAANDTAATLTELAIRVSSAGDGTQPRRCGELPSRDASINR